MPLDEAIRKRGFQRWYSRQLVESHAHLVTGLLALIMMAIAIEMIEFKHSAGGWLALLAIAGVGGGLCVFTWIRFNQLLFRAEYLAERATCPACRAYARFEVLKMQAPADTVMGCTLDVRCRGCGQVWTIR
jgi:predicted Zn finger-like uncharacterized protein